MKKLFIKLASKLKGKTPAPPATPMPGVPVFVNMYSQPHVLQMRMLENKMTHGETVTADIDRVRIEVRFTGQGSQAQMYLCPTQQLTIKERHVPGDGLRLPDMLEIQGLSLPVDSPSSGYYELQNVLISSNGNMQIMSTPKTKVKLMHA